VEVEYSFERTRSQPFTQEDINMTDPPLNKRQKREIYRKTHEDGGRSELPKKKFYRQRAHANPFSDHQLS